MHYARDGVTAIPAVYPLHFSIPVSPRFLLLTVNDCVARNEHFCGDVPFHTANCTEQCNFENDV